MPWPLKLALAVVATTLLNCSIRDEVKAMNDGELQRVADRIVSQAFSSDGVSALDQTDFTFFLTWSYAGILDNGGHAAFFFNSTGEFTPETVAALKQIGLYKQAELLEHIASLLFGHQVPRDLEERNARLSDLPDDGPHDSALESVDDDYFALGGGEAVYKALSHWYAGGGHA